MLSALALAAAVEGTFTLIDRTEARVRAPDPVTNSTAFDIENVPDARIVLSSPHFVYTLGYTPRLAFVDFNESGSRPSILNAGLVSAQWHERKVRVTLTENASYGDQTFAALSVLPTTGTPAAPSGSPGAPISPNQPVSLPTTDAVPAVALLSTMSSVTTLASQVTLRRMLLTASVGYQVSGGADTAAQQILPLQHGPFAETDFDVTATRRDHFVTVVLGSDAAFSTGVDSVLLEVLEQWRHKWSRSTDTELGGGVSGVRSRLVFEAPYTYAADPIVNGAINHELVHGADRVELRADAGFGPTVDRLTGLADQRVYGTLQAIGTHRRFGLRIFGTAMESVPQSATGALRLIEGEVDALFHVSKVVTIDGGLRGLWENLGQVAVTTGAPATGPQAPTSTGLSPQLVAFLGVTVAAVKSRF